MTRFTLGGKSSKSTASFRIPPQQAIGAGWRLLSRGLWYWLTGRDLWIGVEFRGK